MASDERIEILIKAVDEATATMKNIEKQVVSTAKNSEKANQSLSQSFSAVQGAMLNLGQIALGVERIFGIHNDAVMRLENAHDRLEGATIRLKQAQQELLDVTRGFAREQLDVERATIADARAKEKLKVFTDRLSKGVKFHGERLKDYEDAVLDAKEAELDLKDAQIKVSDQSKILKDKQDAVTIATNNQERAERGLEKATGDMTKAYIAMGVQILSVAGNMASFAGNIPNVIKSIGGLSGAIGTAGGSTGVIGSIGALVPALGVAAGGMSLIWLAMKQQADDYKKKVDEVTAQFGVLTGEDLNAGMAYQAQQKFLIDSGQITGPTDIDMTGINTNINPNLPSGGYSGNISRLALPWVQAARAADEYKTKSELASRGINTSINTMSLNSNDQIDTIQVNLSEIPTDIYTYHHIITVRS